ncbi:zinc-binding dehydrogenase, partial [Nonomuraea wenchangensis]
RLARLGGAYVVASTGDPQAHGDGLRALGAHEVVAAPELASGTLDGIVDCVGGPQLVQGFMKLAPHGTLVSVGHSAEEPEVFPPGAFYGDAGRHGRSIVTFYLLDGQPLEPDLTWLAARVADGVLDPHVSWRGGWDRAGEAVSALLERRLHGKAVLDVS